MRVRTNKELTRTKLILTGALAVLSCSFTACSASAQHGAAKTIVVREVVNELEKERVPGTVEDVWVEPMYNMVRQPGALDPKGIYYRPSHTTLVEIRPGKFQPVQYPDYNGQYSHPSSSGQR